MVIRRTKVNVKETHHKNTARSLSRLLGLLQRIGFPSSITVHQRSSLNANSLFFGSGFHSFKTCYNHLGKVINAIGYYVEREIMLLSRTSYVLSSKNSQRLKTRLITCTLDIEIHIFEKNFFIFFFFN